ncbi:MAG: PorV/PorQ family protein [Candidatus Eisenbacteria bacterium]
MRYQGKGVPFLAVVGSVALLMATVGLAFADSNHAAAYSRIGVGARALGMGGAYVAVADDPTATVWNPAGLARVDKLAFTFMYTGGYEFDRAHNFFGYAQSFSLGSVGIGWTNAGMDGLARRSTVGPSEGDFDISDNLVLLSLAHQYGPFGFGLTGKIFDQKIDGESESGGGVDLGAFFEAGKRVNFGLVLQDIASEIGDDDVPYNLRAGVCVNPIGDLLLAADIEQLEDDQTVWHVGGEAWFEYYPGYLLAIRAGVSDVGRDHQDNGYSAGLGLKVPRFYGIGLDYAFVDEMEESFGNNHRISLNLAFGESERDRDGDGIPDYDDQCPNSAEDFDGFEDEDGCPDLDNDGDGIVDELDSCPDEAEDFDGMDDADGCPEEDDQDRDGILDVDDKCPHQPEDFDGFEDKDGCPDVDNDQDGILDADDRCMNNAETFNNFQDEDGCPDIAPKETLKNCNFEFNKAVLLPGCEKILDELVRSMKANPDVMIEVQGHTDNVGSASYNQQLSEKRAGAVMQYLVDHGINQARLKAVGKGKAAPVADNNTEAGRLQNRRVEIHRLN